MRLSKNEKDVLEKIVGYGGYVTKEILALYRTDISLDRCYRILTQLSIKGYIKKRDYFSSSVEPIVYQVTRKACALFGRPEAYMRKVHKAYAIRRYLLRAHYLFSISSKSNPTSLFSSASREDYLRYRGFSDYHLTKKTNKGVEKIQIEEYILDKEPYTKGNSIFIVFIDNLRYSPYGQLVNLFDKYGRMIKASRAFLDFMIVTEDSDRSKQFEDLYHKHFEKDISMVGLKACSMNRSYKSQYAS